MFETATTLLTTCGLCLLGPCLIPAQAATNKAVALSVPSAHRTGFTRLPPSATGVQFTNLLAQDRHLTNQILLNASGLAAGDVDGDGLCDLYFCRLDGPNALYRNLGNWKFEEITDRAGVACPDQDSTGAALADLDGDNDLDLIVNSLGRGTRIFFNDSRGRFEESKDAPPWNQGRAGMSLALADIDGDGDLDVYVANYRMVTLRDQPNTRFGIKMVNGTPVVNTINGKPLTDPEWTNRFNFTIQTVGDGVKFLHDENGEPDLLLRNEGRGRFEPVSFTDGTFLDAQGQPLQSPELDWGLTAMFRDLNGDGRPDLYVCNDFKSEDRIWMNEGRGRFRALPSLAMRQTPLSSMGVDVADINRDGWDDILVLDMLSQDHVRRLTQRMEIKPEKPPVGAIDNRPQYPRNGLFVNRGDGTYAELSQFAGLEATEWSWTPIFLDVDLDGYEDVLVSNGFERDGMNVDILARLEALKRERTMTSEEQLRLRRIFPRLNTPNLAFRNLGNLKFQEVSAAWGFDQPAVSSGMALADLDGDGDLDVIVSNLNEAAGVFRNEASAPRLSIRLHGRSPNTRGIGARIKVDGGPVFQSQQVISGGRYLSSDDPMRVFAAGSLTNRLTVEVVWPSGAKSKVLGAQPNHLYEIDESSAEVSPILLSPTPPLKSLLEDVSATLGHRHTEQPFNDFELQPLLSHQWSQPGPGVAWFDLDQDGWDDLIVAAGQGGLMAAYRNQNGKGFQAMDISSFKQPVTRDQTSVLGWRSPEGRIEIMAANSSVEDGGKEGPLLRRYEMQNGSVHDGIAGEPWSAGPMALADVDGDGDLDLFVGGRVVPNQFPLPASSLLVLQKKGQWQIDRAGSAPFDKIGLVQAAVFSDVDGDGDSDLVLACHWGPVRVFLNAQGRFADATSTLGLNRFLGWWNGVATGDVDGDGRPDIIASNWGQNSRFERYRSRPLALYGGDLDGNGTVECVEAYQDPSRRVLLPLQARHIAAVGLPLLLTQFQTQESYARATLDEIYGAALQSALRLEANWLESTVFLNRGSTFEARALPAEAQWAPAFAVCVADADGDGFQDVFLSQNFFATHPEISRYDAGRGLWLRGNGAGAFQAWSAQESGVDVYGEQRGAAVGDYDADGRVDLVVTQNGAATRLFRNVQAKPGLRIRLRGGLGNPEVIGAALRVAQGSQLGPLREVQAGSGYLGQNSAVTVLSAPGGQPVNVVWVRWPEGQTNRVTIPPGAVEVAIDATGKVERLR